MRTFALTTALALVGCKPATVSLGDDTGVLVDPEQCTWYYDADEDGFGDDDTLTEGLCEDMPEGMVTVGGDCDDLIAAINPEADEVCDEVDNNCDGAVDVDAVDAGTWYVDADGDGYGDDATAAVVCEQPPDTIALGGDCDDTDTAWNPGATEDDCADPNDYNCDGSTGYDDLDGDGWAACEECDDTDAAINPDATEVCDGADNDCDALIDDADDSLDDATTTTFYADTDGDGYGDAASTVQACAAPAGTVSNATDCDDGRDDISPGAAEVCDGVDNDCDGLADDEDGSLDTTTTSTWYADDDADGYGDSAGGTVDACADPGGYAATDDDCDDSDSGVSPGAAELCDGADQDCDGVVDNGFADTDSDGTMDCVDDCPVYADPTLSSNGDGSSSSPYMSVNDAISLRGGYCDEILLYAGTYEETVDYGGDDLSIASIDGAETTILDASSSGGSVVTFTSGESSAAVLEGVTLTGGTGTAGDGSRVTNSYSMSSNDTHGGGVLIMNADPTIRDCIITDNSVDGFGGGVAAYEYAGTFEGNTVSSNLAEYDQFSGGGLWLYNATATVTGNTFIDNEAGGSSGDGGGVMGVYGTLTVSHNWFEANLAAGTGGGARFYDVEGTFYNNVMADHADDALAMTDGSAMDVINNTFNGNGHGILLDSNSYDYPSGDYINNNITSSATYGLYSSRWLCGDISFEYNNVWDSGSDDYSSGTCEYYFDGRSGNTSEDPLYSDPQNNDLSLRSSSGVKNAGADTSGYGVSDDYDGAARPQGSGYSIGAYEQ
ncbi:MAG: right-handed parallel beta-helix repeat-containing protein [Alphaproteobacteria bacterium]|nr:right-handed parallel beta-helix repeat-containing protein [Alphaproteobacteria bacterium]